MANDFYRRTGSSNAVARPMAGDASSPLKGLVRLLARHAAREALASEAQSEMNPTAVALSEK
jgi:hypothetical protein